MSYEKPPCTFNQIDRAGKVFFDQSLSIEDRAEAIDAIWNWRTAHGYPLNALHMTLKNRTQKVEKTAFTAQRLKRLPSILRKLGRHTTMQMSQMQDIGGCRAVVSNMPRLQALLSTYADSPLRHELGRPKDYIAQPKDDGYRSVHHMYRFSGNGNSVPWHKLRIEVQMRTKLQHAWATAVETVDAFASEDLKFGRGTTPWRRFFKLMGSVHAHMERTPIVPGTPKDLMALFDEVKYLEHELEVVRKLRSYVLLTSKITGETGPNRDWFVLQMLPADRRVLITGYAQRNFAEAKRQLAQLEKEYQGTKNQAALVATASLQTLKRAYPNYFADTANFTSVLENFVRKNQPASGVRGRAS